MKKGVKMLDNLKDHVNNVREDFEIYPFDEEAGWQEIAQKVAPQPKKKEPWKIAGIAACFAFVAFGAVFFMNPVSQPNDELAELEGYYSQQINQKITLVKSHLEDDRILEDLTAMDQAFAELKSDLRDNVDNQEVIEAMMENYKLKLQILEEILKELEKEKIEEVL